MNDWYVHLFAAVAMAWIVVWEALDAYVSKMYPLYVEYEANKLARDTTGDDAGYYEPAKSYALTAAVLAIGVVLWIVWTAWAPTILFSVAGTYIAVVVWKNFKVMRQSRTVQRATLMSVKASPETYRAHIMAEIDYHKRPIWFVGPDFWDVRILREGPSFDDPAERERAADRLTAKMLRLAAKDPSKWWRVGRAADI